MIKFFQKRDLLISGFVAVLVLGLMFFFPHKDTFGLFSLYDEQEGDSEELTLQDLKNRDSLGKTAQAVAGMPWQFGGVVTTYNWCVVDNQSGTCPSSCPECTTMVGSACSGYEQIRFTPALGTTPSYPPGTVCVPQGFMYHGAGFPSPGAQILGGGASPQLPWIIGVGF